MKFFSIWLPVNLLAVLVSLPEFLGEVHCCEISHTHTPPTPSRRSLGLGWGQPASSSSANSPTLRTLSKIVKKPLRSSPRFPCALSTAPSSSLRPVNWAPAWPTSYWASILVKSGVNRFSRHVMGLAEFPNTLQPVILHFGNDISNGSPWVEVLLIHRRHWYSFFLPFYNHLCLHFLQGLVTIGLLDNFLKLLKIGWGKERKINGGLLKPVRWEMGKGLKQKVLHIESAIKKIFNHTASPMGTVPDNLGVWIRRIHTSFVVSVCEPCMFDSIGRRSILCLYSDSSRLWRLVVEGSPHGCYSDTETWLIF